MKISICSDLHLEFGPIDLKNVDNAEVLILSGDIMVGSRPNPDFLKMCADQFSNVIYVAGNHEFYHGKWNKTLNDLKEMCDKIDRVHFLENQSVEIKDILFVGCTLWTDMNNMDTVTMFDVQRAMNDFRIITFDEAGIYRKLDPKDVVQRHLKSKQFILDEVARTSEDQKIVVVGHHAPSKASTHPRYIDEYTINGAYSSDLSGMILDNPKIKLFTHGHTHEPFDYMIGSTRIFCNPRGYANYEERAENFELKTVEV